MTMTMMKKAPHVRARSISALRRCADAAGYAAACAQDDLEAPRFASSVPILASAALALAAGVALVMAW